MQEIVDFVEEFNKKSTEGMNKKELQQYNYTKTVVVDELDKFDCIGNILANYETAKQQYEYISEQEDLQELHRNIDLEEKIMAFKIKGAKNKANKAKVQFDEEAFVKEFIQNSRFIKDKSKLDNLHNEEQWINFEMVGAGQILAVADIDEGNDSQSTEE